MRLGLRSKALEELIGGYEPGKIYHFYGHAGTGKTHLACYHPLSALSPRLTEAMRNDERVIAVIYSCDGSFDWGRFFDIYGGGFEERPELRRYVQVVRPVDFDHQHSLIVKTLPAFLESRGLTPVFIAVDPMTSFYRIEFMTTKDARRRISIALQRTGQLEEQLSVLKAIAEKYDCPVAVTNWLKANHTDEDQPWYREFGGGKGFEFYPSVSVRLEEVCKRPKIVKATVTKHRFGEEGRSCYFAIDCMGVRDLNEEEKRLVEKLEKKTGGEGS